MSELIRELVINKREEIIRVYDELHKIPELSMQEYRTSEFIKNYLQNFGLKVISGIANTGLVVYIRGQEPGPVLGIRADIDALGHVIDGKIVPIHSCGHDAHATMGIFAGLISKELGLVQRGSLKLIFQPSEEQESTSGARAMIKDGVLNDLDMLIGIHLRPIHEARFGQAISALRHGALNTITAEIIGIGSHAGRPHLGKSPIDAIASIINAINAIWVNPSIPSSAKVTSIYSDAANYSSIPGTGKLGVDLRANTNEIMDELITKVCDAIENGAKTTGCNAMIEVVPGLAAAVFHEDMIKVANKAIIKSLGKDGLLGEMHTTGAEDFHEYVKAKPELKTTYIGLGCDLQPGLHDVNMSFNKDALLDGVSILTNMVKDILC